MAVLLGATKSKSKSTKMSVVKEIINANTHIAQSINSLANASDYNQNNHPLDIALNQAYDLLVEAQDRLAFIIKGLK